PGGGGPGRGNPRRGREPSRGRIGRTCTSDHPGSGVRIGRLQSQVGAHGRAVGADAVLDVRGAHAAAGGIGLGIDRIATVDTAGRILAGEDGVGLIADVHRVLNVDRPALAVPPDHAAVLQIVASQNLHGCASSAIWASAASLRAVTSPMMMRAGLLTRCVSTSAGKAASEPRSTRIRARAAFSTTATGTCGESPSAISFSAIWGAVLTPM